MIIFYITSFWRRIILDTKLFIMLMVIIKWLFVHDNQDLLYWKNDDQGWTECKWGFWIIYQNSKTLLDVSVTTSIENSVGRSSDGSRLTVIFLLMILRHAHMLIMVSTKLINVKYNQWFEWEVSYITVVYSLFFTVVSIFDKLFSNIMFFTDAIGGNTFLNWLLKFQRTCVLSLKNNSILLIKYIRFFSHENWQEMHNSWLKYCFWEVIMRVCGLYSKFINIFNTCNVWMKNYMKKYGLFRFLWFICNWGHLQRYWKILWNVAQFEFLVMIFKWKIYMSFVRSENTRCVTNGEVKRITHSL